MRLFTIIFHEKQLGRNSTLGLLKKSHAKVPLAPFDFIRKILDIVLLYSHFFLQHAR